MAQVRDMRGTGRYAPYPRYRAIQFYSAVRKGDPEMLSHIMSVDPYFITQDNGGGAPIHFAATYRQLDMIHHLLNNGAEVNQRDRKHGLTALHRVAALGHIDGYLEIYEYLLSRGADPSILSKEYDPYLNPGQKRPVDLAKQQWVKDRILSLEKRYASVPKAREPNPAIGCFFSLYDYGPEVVATWDKDYVHPYPEEVKRQKEKEDKARAREKRREADLASIKEAARKAPLIVAPSAPAPSQEPAGEIEAAAPSAAAGSSGSGSIPQTPVAFLFPGQGSQGIGMAKDAVAKVPAAKDLFDRASKILGYDLLKVCLEGPKDKLDDTVYSQPALLVASLAAVEKLKKEEPGVVDKVSAAAGLSLGEYSALVFAGVLSFEDAVKVVKVRAENMARCAKEGKPHGMLSVVGLDDDKLKKIVEDVRRERGKDAVCQLANFLFPTGRVVSGHKDALDDVSKAATQAGALRAAPLAVSGAFHTPLMHGARDALTKALSEVTFHWPPRCHVISNVTGRPFTSADDVRDLLPRQLVEPVQWESTLNHLVTDLGKSAMYEVGPQKQIRSMVRRISEPVWKEMKNIEP